jgi:UDP-glucose 4-epimerase
MVIPRFVSQALNNEDITVFGTGQQTRCFLHVRDAVGALISLMDETKAVGEVFNVGSQEEVSIEGLARRIIEMAGSKSELIYISYEKAYEQGFEDMQRRVPDISKINKYIGFRPQINLNGIIKDVINFCKNG